MIKGHTKTCRKNWKIVYGGFYCETHKSFIDWEEDFLEDMKQVFKNEGKTCLYCRHLKDLFDSSCPAFPKVIPCPFLTGIKVHKKPTRYQKNNIVFEPRLSCPFCKSKNTIPLVFGHPSKKNIGRWLRGEVQISRCEISEKNFNRFCKDCLREFLAGNKIIKKEKK